MPKKQSREERLSTLAKYNVFHDHNKRQAPGHEDSFDDISELASIKLNNYSYAAQLDSEEKPWRRKTLERAKAVSERARRCLDERRNEAGWRSHLEPWIFKRFEVEVACSDCRARLWRSELEAAATNSKLSLKSLQERRAARKPCQCAKHRSSVEKYDDGLNNLFEDRLEDGIVHEEAVMCALQKKKEIPDRVWGLRTTKRIERILAHQRPAETSSIREFIRTSPFKGDASRLLYPFLVLETKSEKSSDSLSDINTQTGLIVRNLLNLQHELMLKLPEHAQANMQDRCPPLVWVLASKGEYWRLSGAYTSEGRAGIEYHILDLWDGRLVHEEHSLCLLLILDYVFDWARDIYRRLIIDGLLSLVRSPSHSLRSDTDIFSITDYQQNSINFENSVPEGNRPNISKLGKSSTLRFYDRPGLAIRDSSFMSHSVVGLQITGENWEECFKSVSKTQEELLHLAQQLHHNIGSSDCWYVTAECLSSLEKLWTGRDREPEVFQNPQQKFLVCFTVLSYFGIGVISSTSRAKQDRWLQVHKLGFVAIAQDALDKIENMLKEAKCRCFREFPQFSTQEVVEVFEKLRNAPVRQCFAAAIQKLQVLSSYSSARFSKECSSNFKLMEKMGLHRPTLIQTQSSTPPLFELLELIHRRLKPGMREPAETFLLTSVSEREHTSNNSECLFWADNMLQIGDRELAVQVSQPEKSILGMTNSIARCIFLLPPSTTESKAYQSGREQGHVSVHTLEMQDTSRQISHDRCIEKLCKRELWKALEILYHVSGCYFEFVHPRSEPTWRNLFGEWQFNDLPTNLDLPTEETREHWLDLLREAGTDFSLGETLKILIEAYGRALRTPSSSTDPKRSPELMPRSALHVCDCPPFQTRRSSDKSPLEQSRGSNSPLSLVMDRPQMDDLNQHYLQRVGTISSWIQADRYINEMLPDGDESMNDSEDESTLNDDDSMDTSSTSSFLLEMPRAETGILIRLDISRGPNSFAIRDSGEQRFHQEAASSKSRTQSVSPTSEILSTVTTNASSSGPFKRISIGDLLNP